MGPIKGISHRGYLLKVLQGVTPDGHRNGFPQNSSFQGVHSRGSCPGAPSKMSHPRVPFQRDFPRGIPKGVTSRVTLQCSLLEGAIPTEVPRVSSQCPPKWSPNVPL